MATEAARGLGDLFRPDVAISFRTPVLFDFPTRWLVQINGQSNGRDVFKKAKP